jgi:proteasome lid subunit RPN8/RPN11
MDAEVQINAKDWQQIVDLVQSLLPEEACGFLAGRDGAVSAVLPITNRLHSQVRYEMDPRQQLNAMLWMEENALDLLAIFHSHPKGPAVPSLTDLTQYYYPEAVCVIVSPDGAGWQLRAFKIIDSRFEELLVRFRVNNNESGG